MTTLRAVGLTCGIGSMLVGARMAGFEILGNIEWRKYYHRKDPEGKSTSPENSPGAFMTLKYDQLSEAQRGAVPGVDLAMGHPECGSYTQLNSMTHSRVEKSFYHD